MLINFTRQARPERKKNMAACATTDNAATDNAATAPAAPANAPIELNVERYIALLRKLIPEARHVQNHPPKYVPEEDRVIQHLLALLSPHSKEKGGVLKISHVTFVEKRGNLILEYRPPTAKSTVAFVGSHLDVVPADPATWCAREGGGMGLSHGHSMAFSTACHPAQPHHAQPQHAIHSRIRHTNPLPSPIGCETPLSLWWRATICMGVGPPTVLGMLPCSQTCSCTLPSTSRH